MEKFKLWTDYFVAMPKFFQEGTCTSYACEATQNIAQVIVGGHSPKKVTGFQPGKVAKGRVLFHSHRNIIKEIVLLEDFLNCRLLGWMFQMNIILKQ